MSLTLPETHLIDNEKLEGEAYFDLFEITLRSAALLYFHPNTEVTWQGIVYAPLGMKLSDVSDFATSERSRPTLSIMNIDGAFSPFARDGEFNRAVISRKRVLKQHILNNSNIFQERTWLMWNAKTVNKAVMEFELRTPADGQGFNLPARRYIPPEFPFVSLG